MAVKVLPVSLVVMLSCPERRILLHGMKRDSGNGTFLKETSRSLRAKSNGNDRRQWRKQGVAVGAAACKMRVPPKAQSRCREPQPGHVE